MPYVRKANEDDSKDIFDWRNDKLTRQMSHTTDLIEWYGHSHWFAATQTNQNRLIVICEDEYAKEKIAMVRFDIKDQRALISIILSPKMRGKRKTKECLIDAISFFKSLYSNIQSIDAEIKSINIASQQSFLGVGFLLVQEKDDVLFYKYII
jgi:RimJ/RimL family protein N-acetyltransferase